MSSATSVPSGANLKVKVREPWIDVARGIAILLVVSTHAGLFSDAIGARSAVWDAINAALYTLRMPMFFCVSGLLALSAIQRPWGYLFRNKILLLVWLYALWVIIRFAYFAVVPQVVNPDESGSLLRLAAQAIWSSSDTWFLYALAVFFTVAKLISRLPVWLQLSAAALLSAGALSSVIELPSTLWNGLIGYFFFFMLGVHGGKFIRAWAGRPLGMTLGLIILPAWIALTWVALSTGAFDVLGVRFLLSIAAVIAGIGVAIALSRVALLGYLGRNTLPVYLSHTLWIGGFTAALSALVPTNVLERTAGWLPLALVTASVAVALLVRWAANQIGARWLYDLPRWLSRAVAERRTNAVR